MGLNNLLPKILIFLSIFFSLLNISLSHKFETQNFKIECPSAIDALAGSEITIPIKVSYAGVLYNITLEYTIQKSLGLDVKPERDSKMFNPGETYIFNIFVKIKSKNLDPFNPPCGQDNCLIVSFYSPFGKLSECTIFIRTRYKVLGDFNLSIFLVTLLLFYLLFLLLKHNNLKMHR